MFVNLQQRSKEEEIMDDLESSGQIIDQTLKELEIINRLLGGNQISIDALASLLENVDKEIITVLDLGCGGGDILMLMADWARRANRNIRFIGIDANPNIVTYAEKNCKDYPEISFETLNIFSPEFRSLKCDILHASLFTHHFTQEQLFELFSTFKQQAQIGIIINDLHRHFLAYYSIKWITRFFSKSPMVQHDAALSVARSFRKADLEEIMQKNKMTNYELSWKWAFRWKLVIEV
ncbi:MAG: methyltransferase domain-containing protein [Bacteroidota bacterium]